MWMTISISISLCVCIVWLLNRFSFIYSSIIITFFGLVWFDLVGDASQRFTTICTYFLCFRSYLITFFLLSRVPFLALPPSAQTMRVRTWMRLRDHTTLLQVYAQICIWFLSILISFNTFNYSLFKYIRHNAHTHTHI